MNSFLIFVFAILGLQLGSFLNVVIYRLPKQLQREWRVDCAAYLEVTVPHEEATPLMSWQTRSQCPHCGTTLRARDLVPVLSFLLLRGRCAHCQHPVSWRYPLVELAVMAAWGLCAMHWGPSWVAVLWACFVTTLIALAFIDVDTQLLPDQLTQPLLWAGLIAAVLGWTAQPFSPAFWGAIAGYMSLWLVAYLFEKIRGQAGMGAGDFKLFAAMGAWLGVGALPLLVLGASVGTVLVALVMHLTGRGSADQRMPFGPYLVLAALAVLWLNTLGFELTKALLV
ncbi:A24 family peptidase [Limnohabitans sp.]|uniref:prepilin peptidase n=1 Tax=Limnohabitans sp. TaxID=1907725 RepID=UPI00286F7AFF|nr:A24 family peptidase [Limnohabitans sp.]